MAQIPVWFGRKFDFSFPIELMPNLLARLRGTPARLEEALRGHDREALVARYEGTWSPQENAGHLFDLEQLWLARVEDYVNGSDGLTPTDLQNGRTHGAGHNDRPLEDVLADFRTARSKLLARAGNLDTSFYSRAIPHPRLKTPMRLADHLFFVAEHDDHHLARIHELLRSGRA